MLLSAVMIFGMLPVNALASEVEILMEEDISVAETAAPETTAAPVETEAAVAETTQPVQAPVETVPVTEAAPVQEEPVPAVAETEAAAAAEETEPAFTVTSYTAVPDQMQLTDEELFRGYAEQQLYGTQVQTFGTAGGAQLSGDEKKAYDALVPYLKQIASGQRTDATIHLGISLGNQNFTGTMENYDADTEVQFTGSDFDQPSLTNVLRALLADMPYELYWFDKVTGVSDLVISAGGNLHIVFNFQVAANYRGADALTADASKTGAAAATAAAAQAVVDSVEADENVKTDYDKLVAYKDWICRAVSYNTNAAATNSFVRNSDPWQVIYVFDGDTSTKVVCEGYSKAFQYLCDLTEFDGDVVCYSVTGTMGGGTGAGAHMWNIVTIQGQNYLVDVTNSDSGTAGANGQLFLAGVPANANGSYTISGVTFTYDESTQSLWENSTVLNMSEASFDPAAATVVGSGSCGSYATWTLDSNGLLTISGRGAMEDYLLYYDAATPSNAPWDFNAVKKVVVEENITHIGNAAFRGCVNLTEVTLPDTVYTIGQGAFEGTQIVTIDLPADLIRLGEQAFRDCTALTEVILPDALEEVGNVVFENCTSLKSATWPAGVTTVSWSAFRNCSALESVELPDNLIYIDDNAFAYCGALEAIDLPSGLETIGNGAFFASGLRSITIPRACEYIGGSAILTLYLQEIQVEEGNSEYYASDGVLFSGSRLLVFPRGRGGEYTIPDTITSIDASAFSWTSLESLTIPANVTEIPENSFDGGNSLLKEVHFQGDAQSDWENIFGEAECIGYYPPDNDTWKAGRRHLIGMNVTWLEEGSQAEEEDPVEPSEPTNPEIPGEWTVKTQADFVSELNAAISAGNTDYTLYQQVLTLDSDLTITLPDGFGVYINSAAIVIPQGKTLTVNGGQNGSGITFNQGYLNVDGTLNMNAALFLNDNSTATVNGTLNSNVALHVGFWKQDNAAYTAGTLTVNGTMNNRGFFNIAPSNSNCGGIVTVNGTLNSLRNEPDAEGNAMHGFIQLDGTMNVNSGATLSVAAEIWNGGILVGGDATLAVQSGVDLSGVEPAMIIYYPQSNANVSGIPNNLLLASYEVYSTEEMVSTINTINASGYANAEIHPMGGFLLEQSVTIPENTVLVLDNPDHDNYYWLGMGIGNNSTLTNNGQIFINDWARLAIEGGSSLVNNGYIGIAPNGWLMHMGEFEDNGTVESEGQFNDGTMSHDDLVAHLANANGWVHEMTTRLERDLTIDLPNGFFLDTYGRLIVPSGVTLTLNGNVEFVGWGEINVEDGGTLIINGTLTIPEDRGWVNIYPGAECQINGTVNGEINYIEGEDPGDTEPYISSYWVHDFGEGFFMNEQYQENRQAQMSPGVNFMWIFYLNVWDEDAGQWVRTPLKPEQLGTEGYVNLVSLSEYDWAEFKPGEPNTDCFVNVVIPNEMAAWDTIAYITYNHNGNVLKMPIYLERDRAAGFYSGPVASNATWMQFGMQINPFGGNTFYLIITDEVMTAQNVRMTNHADKVTMTKVSNTVYRFDVKDEVAANMWQTGSFHVNVEVDMYQDGEFQYTWQRDLSCNPKDLGRYDAWFRINGETYTYYAEGDGFLVSGPNGSQVGTLPSGVFYDYDNNILTLQNATLEELGLSYHWQERDNQGNLVPGGDEHYDLPNQNLTLNLIGSNTISCDYDAALSLDNDIHVTIGGSGSLYLFSDNGTGHTNEWGNYAFNTVQVNGHLTIAGNTTVTAEIAGIGKHGDNDAWLHAVCGNNGAYLTVTDSATLNAKLPQGARRYDDTDDYWGGYAGIENMDGITVEENGKLNTDTLNVSDGRSFTQTGGTVTLNPVGGIWVDNEGTVGVNYEGFWMSGGRLDLSGGTLTINAQVSSGENGNFTGIGTENSVVNISGGTLNINSNSQGCSLGIGCQFNEQGPIAGTGSTLNVSGGTININTAMAMNAAMDVYPISTANFTGGTINVDMAHFYFGAVKDNEPAIIWDGTTLNGDCVGIHLDGSFEMRSGTIHLENLGFLEANGMVAINGGTIDLDNSIMRVNMGTGLAGNAYVDIDIDDTILAEPIHAALQNDMYLSLNDNARIDIDIAGLTGTDRVIHGILNNGTFHQMDNATVTVNSDANAPVMLSVGQLLLNDGTLSLNGGNIALVQAHDYERSEENRSMTQVIDGTLNANGGRLGILVNGLVVIEDANGTINASARGAANNDISTWPVAIFVEKQTGNADLTGENVSEFIVNGGTVNLTAVDTSNNEACSKGLVAWYAPVVVNGQGETINIEAEMAVYSASESAEETYFHGDISFFDVDANTYRNLTAIPMGDGYVHTVKNGDEYVGKMVIASGVDTGLVTQNQLQAALDAAWAAGEHEYHLHQMVTVTSDWVLSLPENFVLYVDGTRAGITVSSGATLYVNGGMNGSSITFNQSTLNVEGELVLNNDIFLNDSSTANVSGKLVNNVALHVGYWRAGTLNITGTLDNYGYLNIGAITANGGGTVNVEGTLNNLSDEEQGLNGFIEHHGVMNVNGTLNNNMGMVVCGGVYIRGTVNNNSNSIEMLDEIFPENEQTLEIIAYTGAVVNNNGSILNASHGVLDLSKARYNHGQFPNGEAAEVLTAYFDDGTVAMVKGVAIANIYLRYEGANAQSAMDMVDYAGANRYGKYIIRVNGEMTIPEGAELVINEDSYLVVLYDGHLILNGTVYNRGTMRLFGADLTIGIDGWLSNTGLLETFDTGNGNYRRPQITVDGTMENYITGTMDLNAADCIPGNGMIGNDLVDGEMGTIEGLDISRQTVWTGISDGNGQEQLKSLIQWIRDEGYRNGMLWLAVDTTITEQVIVPENITIIMQDGEQNGRKRPTTLTIAPINNETLEGGWLYSEGYLNITESSKIVNNGLFVIGKNLLNLMEGATIENNGQLNNMGLARIREGSTLINNGLIQNGSSTGDASMNVEGEYIHGENASLENMFVVRNDGIVAHRAFGVDMHLQKLVHTIREELPLHNEASLLRYFDIVSHSGYIGGNVYILRDMDMRSNWYVEPLDWEDEKYSGFDVDVYVDGCTLTVPEVYNTLGANTSFYVRNGGKIDIQGAMFLHTDMLIQDGGTLNVDGTMNAGTVYVYEGGTLVANGNWRGYNPHNYGGTITGSAFAMTQDQLENLLAQAEQDQWSQVSLRTTFTLERDLTLNTHLNIMGKGIKLIVPEGVTLTIGERAHVAIWHQGEVEVHGKLVNNGTVQVGSFGPEDGITGTLTSDGEIHNNNSVYVSSSGQLIAHGLWIGNRPEVAEGGIVGGTAFEMDQDALEDLIANGQPLRSQVTLDSNLVLEGSLTISSGGHLIVPKGKTLTVKGYLFVENGGKIDVEAGGKLVNNGGIYNHDCYSNGYIHVAGSYSGKGIFQVDAVMNKIADVTGVAIRNLNLNYNNADEETLHYAIEAGVGYGMVTVYTSNTEALAITEDVTIPANLTLLINGEAEIEENVTVTVNGSLVVYHFEGVNNYVIHGSLTNNGSLILNKGSYLNIFGDYFGNAPINNGGTITPKAQSVTIEAVENITIDDKGKANIEQGDPAPVLRTVVDNGIAGLQAVTWTSSNKKVVDAAQIIDNGDGTYTIPVIGGGTTKLTATAIDGSKKSDFINLTVTPAQVKTLTLTPSELILDKAGLTDVASRTFTIGAEAQDKHGNTMTLDKKAIKWTSSDTKLASVKVNNDGSATLTIAAGKDGTATITAQSTDLAKAAATMTVTVYDKAPKLGAAAVTLNPRMETGVNVALIPGYQNAIEDVSIDSGLDAVYDPETQLLNIKGDPDLKNGNLNTKVTVTCEEGEYTLNLKVTVKSTIPSITIKQNTKMDLFYKGSTTTLTVTAKDTAVVGLELAETDDFYMDEDGVIHFAEDLADKYADNAKYKPDTKADLLVYLEGYSQPVEKAITIGTSATKLSLSTEPASSMVNTNEKFGMGLEMFFQLYNKTEKQVLDLEDTDVIVITGYEDEVTTLTDSDELSLTLKEAKKTTLNISVQKEDWMYPVTLKHNVIVTDKDPAVKLGKSTLKLNSNVPNLTDSTSAVLSNGNLPLTGFGTDDLFVSTAKEGSDAWSNAQMIRVEYENAGNGGDIVASILPGMTPKAGTYTFTAVPDVNGVDLKAVTVKVSISSAEPKLTLGAKGKLDAIVPESKIVYTVNKIANVEGKLDDIVISGIEVNGETMDTDLFTLSDLAVDDKGKQYFTLGLNPDVQYSTKATYKVTFTYELCGETFEVKPVNVKVSQSSLKTKATPEVYVPGQAAMAVNLQLTAPVGAQLAEVVVNEAKTAKELIAALDASAIGRNLLEEPEANADLVLTIANGSGLAAGKSYKLALDIIPVGNASDAKLTTVTVNIKIAK